MVNSLKQPQRIRSLKQPQRIKSLKQPQRIKLSDDAAIMAPTINFDRNLHLNRRKLEHTETASRVKTYNPSANQRRAILSVGMESSFLAIRQDGEQIVHTQGTGVVLVYVWRWSSHIEIPGRRPIRSGLGIVV